MTHGASTLSTQKTRSRLPTYPPTQSPDPLVFETPSCFPTAGDYMSIVASACDVRPVPSPVSSSVNQIPTPHPLLYSVLFALGLKSSVIDVWTLWESSWGDYGGRRGAWRGIVEVWYTVGERGGLSGLGGWERRASGGVLDGLGSGLGRKWWLGD